MHDFVCGESGAEGHAVTRGRRPAHPARVSPTADTEGTQGLQLPGQKPAFSLRAEKAGDALVFKCMSQRQRERRGRGREGGTGRRRGPRKWSRAGSWGTGPQHQRLGADPLWPVSAAPEPSPAVRAETWPPPRVRHGRRASPCLTLIPKRLQMLDGGGGHSLESSTRNRVFRVAPLPAHPVRPDLAALLPWPGLCSVSSLWMAEGESACARAELLPLTTLHVL